MIFYKYESNKHKLFLELKTIKEEKKTNESTNTSFCTTDGIGGATAVVFRCTIVILLGSMIALDGNRVGKNDLRSVATYNMFSKGMD